MIRPAVAVVGCFLSLRNYPRSSAKKRRSIAGVGSIYGRYIKKQVLINNKNSKYHDRYMNLTQFFNAIINENNLFLKSEKIN